MDNAINFTSEGGKVIITAGLKNEIIEIKITDTGIGIPEADIPHIFERFYRSDKSRSRETGGTGIGLAIVKELVNLQGGTIDVQSKADYGSTFTFTLPLAR